MCGRLVSQADPARSTQHLLVPRKFELRCAGCVRIPWKRRASFQDLTRGCRGRTLSCLGLCCGSVLQLWTVHSNGRFSLHPRRPPNDLLLLESGGAVRIPALQVSSTRPGPCSVPRRPPRALGMTFSRACRFPLQWTSPGQLPRASENFQLPYFLGLYPLSASIPQLPGAQTGFILAQYSNLFDSLRVYPN